MLSPTDIHYIVGLLTKFKEGEKVNVVLGDSVYDIAAKKYRDVDVTIAYKNPDGSNGIIKGLEVKDHTRPMTVEQVEQLCIKLRDTKSIRHKGIVSASGYSPAAINKASYYGVQLYSLTEWKDRSFGFKHNLMQGMTFFQERSYSWVGNTNIQLLLDNRENIDLNQIQDGATIYKLDGSVKSDVENIEQLCRNLLDNSIKEGTPQLLKHSMKPEDVKSARVDMEITDGACLKVNDQLLPIKYAIITGNLKLSSINKQPIFKILKKIGEDEVLGGCAVTELQTGQLIGISVTNSSKALNIFYIPVATRLLKKIYKQQLSQINEIKVGSAA